MYGDANFINQVPLFSGLDEAQQASLQQKMGQTTLRRGETLFEEGDLGDRLYIVTEGKVKLGHTSNDGRESLLAVLGPGEILGELTLFDPGPRSTTATAVSPATLLHLLHSDLMEIVEANPTLAKHMLRALAQRLRRTNESLSDLVFSDVPALLRRCSILQIVSVRQPIRVSTFLTTSLRKNWPSWSVLRAKLSTSPWQISFRAVGSVWKAVRLRCLTSIV